MRGDDPLASGEAQAAEVVAERPLRNPQFRWLLSSNLAFFMALHGQSIVRSWLAFDLTGSELALGQIAAAFAIPMLLLSPFGGVIADRVERRRLIYLGQVFVLASELVVLFLLWTDRLVFWHLLCGTLAVAAALPMTMPARQAIVVNLVGRQGLPQAMALSMGAMNVTRVLGPLMSGPLIDLLGVRAAYTMGALSYGVSTLCVLRLAPSRAQGGGGASGVFQQIGEAIGYLKHDRLVLILLFFGLLPMFLAMPVQQLLVVFAQEVWQVGSSGFGVLQAVSGVGGVMGALWVSRIDTGRRLSKMLVSGFMCSGVMALFALTPWFWPAVGFGLIAFAASSVFATLNNTAIQLLIDDRVRGRISSFMLMSVSLPLLGTLPVGALAARHGAPLAVAGACALGALTVAAFWILSPALRGLDARMRGPSAAAR